MGGAVERDGFFEAAFADVAPLLNRRMLEVWVRGERGGMRWDGPTGQTVSETILMVKFVMVR